MSVRMFENERWARDDQKVSFRHRQTLALIGSLPQESAATVLDIGCGDGLLLSLLQERGMRVKGIDISEEGAEKARLKGHEIVVADVTGPLPFPDAAFDVVVLLDVLEHVYAPQSLLQEAARVSKRWVIVGVPNFSSIAARLQVLAGAVPENNRPHKGHVYWFNHGVLERMIGDAGLLRRDMRINTVFESRFFGPIFAFLARILPGLFALSFVVLLEKEL